MRVKKHRVARCSPFKRHVRELGLAVHEDPQVNVDQLFEDLEDRKRRDEALI